jgi:FdhE protein
LEKIVGTLEERSQQLKKKRPGYGEILDFYVKVRKLQFASKVTAEVDIVQAREEWKHLPAGEGFALIRKEDFPVDVDAAVSLFQSLCQIGKSATAHMAAEVEKISIALNEHKINLQSLLMEGGNEQAIHRAAADLGLDEVVLSFLIQNSIRPSIEAVREQLQGELDPETWRRSHCPVCGSLPFLNLLKGEAGKRYSLCSYCSYQWRIERSSCAFCGNKDQASLEYFHGEGEDAFRIDLCDKCHHYIKTIDYRIMEASDPCLEDLATLHLNVIAVKKGYTGVVPNSWSI